MNLFEIMRGAGGGNAFEAFARQYGLSMDQVSSALGAFLPAASAGLKRRVADPASFYEMMTRFGMDQWAAYYRDPGCTAASSRRDGQDILSLLFGSSKAVEAITEQASAFTGIAQSTMREIFPAFAATLFGGLQQQSVAANPAFAALFRQFSGAPDNPAGAAKGPLDRYEEEQEEAARREAAGNPMAHIGAEGMRSAIAAMTSGATTWAEMMEKMAAGMVPAAGSAGQTAPPPRPDFFGDMLEPGLRLGEAYQRNLEAIFAGLKPASKPE